MSDGGDRSHGRGLGGCRATTFLARPGAEQGQDRRIRALKPTRTGGRRDAGPRQQSEAPGVSLPAATFPSSCRTGSGGWRGDAPALTYIPGCSNDLWNATNQTLPETMATAPLPPLPASHSPAGIGRGKDGGEKPLPLLPPLPPDELVPPDPARFLPQRSIRAVVPPPDASRTLCWRENCRRDTPSRGEKSSAWTAGL